MVIIVELILIVILVFLTDTLTYAYIRRLDKKEREKIAERENKRIEELIEKLKPLEENKKEVVDLFDL